MIKKMFIPILILGMVCFVQCKKDQSVIDQNSPALTSDLKAGGHGGGGNGGGGNGGGGGGAGGGGLYGDLVICLRDATGIPNYLEISGEHGLDYFPQPIMVDMVSLNPRKDESGNYIVFELNSEGEVIDDPDDLWIVKEVEFGRLNLVRAPQSVLDAALQEAIGALAGANEILLDASGRIVGIFGAQDWLVNYDDDPNNDEDNDKTIDSPRENVAIYQELMSYRLTRHLSFLLNYEYNDNDVLTFAKGAIAAGADKTGIIIVDEMAYMNDWLLDWDDGIIRQAPGSPDDKGRRYFDFSPYNYSREAEYANKIVRVTELNSGGTWVYRYYSLLNIVPWTNPDRRINYGGNNDITGFSNAADDAVQVLEYIHGSDLVVYSPHFTLP